MVSAEEVNKACSLKARLPAVCVSVWRRERLAKRPLNFVPGRNEGTEEPPQPLGPADTAKRLREGQLPRQEPLVEHHGSGTEQPRDHHRRCRHPKAGEPRSLLPAKRRLPCHVMPCHAMPCHAITIRRH